VSLARLIEGGIPTEALVANVMVLRFADHLPLYRQAQIMARQGVLIDRATLALWVGYGAAEMAPVVRRLKEIVLSSTRIFADETTMKVLHPGRGRTKQGYFGMAGRDDRACGGADRHMPGEASCWPVNIDRGGANIIYRTCLPTPEQKLASAIKAQASLP
jgi:hypothetical protein